MTWKKREVTKGCNSQNQNETFRHFQFCVFAGCSNWTLLAISDPELKSQWGVTPIIFQVPCYEINWYPVIISI